ncbi:MAG: alkaline phosphatase family protein [Candidatus Methylacidiphilales bacterium]|nr:alkaline phosphatase family protein [Candidatus Methylacidiphilales bacterium]
MKRLPLFIFIDAFGWEILRRHPDFLTDLAPYRKPLRTILGYSSACDPSIISGKMPGEHRLWSSFYFAPATSPFRWLRALRFLPAALMNRARVRHLLSRLIKKLHGFTGYFQIYNVPFDKLGLFDYAEKKRIWEPGGLPVGENIFDQLKQTGKRWYVHDSSLPDEEKIRRLEARLEARDIDFAYISLGKLDAWMHAHGPLDAGVSDLVRWYDGQIRALVAKARRSYDEVPFWVFTDHGMHDVTDTVDLQKEIVATGLVYGKDFTAFYDSTMARFWFHRPEARARLTALLDAHPKGRLLQDDELQQLGVFFPDHQYGEMVFLVNGGVLIVPSFMGAKRIAGMHGYHPDEPDASAMICSNQALPESLGSIEQIHRLMLPFASSP